MGLISRVSSRTYRHKMSDLEENPKIEENTDSEVEEEVLEYQDSDDEVDNQEPHLEPSLFHQKFRYMKPKSEPEILKANLRDSNTFFTPKLGQKAPVLLRPRLKRNFNPTSHQSEFYSLLSSYRDIFHSANYHPDSTRPSYTAFALNHVLTAQKIIRDHDSILRKYRQTRLNH